jgi:putative restriction endonuclease
MPAISPHVLINRILDAIDQSGGGAVFDSAVRSHPRKFTVSANGETYSLWIYIWTITHGGRVTLPDEYRIQMTSVTSPLTINPNGLTVLMGYYPELNMFAGFDLAQHRTFTEGSPSVQIGMSVLDAAFQNGLSFSTKDNGEVAIGVRPDQFLNYCRNAQRLHEAGHDVPLMEMLERASELEIQDEDISGLAENRRVIVEEVRRLSRDARFKRSVLSAYDNRCAISRIQLKLVDAAHILPVASENSSDHVTNGIALSPTFHRAYDSRLIYIDENYRIKLNDDRVGELSALNLNLGVDYIRSFEGRAIYLPQNPRQRPSLQYIRLANKKRRIPGY